jgi:hypothetical protein
MQKSLEQEFEEQVFIHKSTVVLGCLMKFYKDQQETGVSIPEFMDESIEEKAQKHYFKLLANNNKFNDVYNSCWEKYGALLP